MQNTIQHMYMQKIENDRKTNIQHQIKICNWMFFYFSDLQWIQGKNNHMNQKSISNLMNQKVNWTTSFIFYLLDLLKKHSYQRLIHMEKTYKSFVDVTFEEFVHILGILYSMEVY